MAVTEAVRAERQYQQYWDALIWATTEFHGVPNVLTETCRVEALSSVSASRAHSRSASTWLACTESRAGGPEEHRPVLPRKTDAG
jgi:hypothetical protein